MKSILTGLTLVMSSIITTMACAEEPVAVEWAPFIKMENITDQQLVKAADTVNDEFISKQPGFIKRELVKKSATEYADIIHWSSKALALAAGNKVADCQPCIGYFMLMDMEQSAKAGAGFSHYQILKTW